MGFSVCNAANSIFLKRKRCDRRELEYLCVLLITQMFRSFRHPSVGSLVSVSVMGILRQLRRRQFSEPNDS